MKERMNKSKKWGPISERAYIVPNSMCAPISKEALAALAVEKPNYNKALEESKISDGPSNDGLAEQKNQKQEMEIYIKPTLEERLKEYSEAASTIGHPIHYVPFASEEIVIRPYGRMDFSNIQEVAIVSTETKVNKNLADWAQYLNERNLEMQENVSYDLISRKT